MTIAFVFPGQGSQSVGMGKAFYEAFPIVRQTLEEANDTLKEKLSTLILDGPAEQLTLTENTQPALVAVSIAILSVIEKEIGHTIPTFVAGHSLGEYAALCAAGVLSLQDALRFVKQRGRAMQEAVPVGVGAMAAILGLEMAELECLLDAFCDAANLCVIANDNSPGQLVVSGHKNAVDEVIAKATAAGAKRALLLPVSAPFHSPLMAPAAHVMADLFDKTPVFCDPRVTIVSNVTAMPVANHANLFASLLVDQITGRVRWRESIMNLEALGVEHFVEIGAGKVLTGLNKRIAPQRNAFAINEPKDLEALAALV